MYHIHATFPAWHPCPYGLNFNSKAHQVSSAAQMLFYQTSFQLLIEDSLVPKNRWVILEYWVILPGCPGSTSESSRQECLDQFNEEAAEGLKWFFQNDHTAWSLSSFITILQGGGLRLIAIMCSWPVLDILFLIKHAWYFLQQSSHVSGQTSQYSDGNCASLYVVLSDSSMSLECQPAIPHVFCSLRRGKHLNMPLVVSHRWC